MELAYSVQNYAWGKKSESSVVAQLLSKSTLANLNPSTNYAELWMGVHPNGPSLIKGSNELLSDHLTQFPDQLGQNIIKQFGSNLPFLFKVLSVETALSIQAHPSKTHAEELFVKYPEVYKDPNHKPELAIALTKFEALCGFRPIKEILWSLKNIPELTELLGDKLIDEFESGLCGIRPCFEKLMKSDTERVKVTIDKYLQNGKESPQKNLAKRLNDQFPGDVGVLCVFWLNYLELQPGDSIFLAPNEPHAYIYGDCIECMSNSDNVVRAGLTPKFRDVQTLCDMLTYKSYSINELLLKPIKEDNNTKLFRPPVHDFAVAQISALKNDSYTLITRDSASIIIVISGKSTVDLNGNKKELQPGVVLFIPAGQKLTLIPEIDQTLYQAFCY